MNNVQALKKVESELSKTKKTQEDKIKQRAELTAELDAEIASCQSRIKELSTMKKLIEANIKRENEASERLAEMLGISPRKSKKGEKAEEVEANLEETDNSGDSDLEEITSEPVEEESEAGEQISTDDLLEDINLDGELSDEDLAALEEATAPEAAKEEEPEETPKRGRWF